MLFCHPSHLKGISSSPKTVVHWLGRTLFLNLNRSYIGLEHIYSASKAFAGLREPFVNLKGPSFGLCMCRPSAGLGYPWLKNPSVISCQNRYALSSSVIIIADFAETLCEDIKLMPNKEP